MPTDLRIRDLTADAFAPYGTIIARPDRPVDAAGNGWSWWAEAGILPMQANPYAIGYLDLTPAPLIVEWLERHAESVEAIIPLDGPCLLSVATDPENVVVFRLRPGEAVVLNHGIWHGAPMAIDTPLNALILLARGTGSRDVETKTLDEHSRTIARNDL